MKSPAKKKSVSEKADRFGDAFRLPDGDPIKSLALFFRGRVKTIGVLCGVFCPILAVAGFQLGSKFYESTAILRIYPQEKNILYENTDSSVLKTFDTYVRAETTYLASYPVMELALSRLVEDFPEIKDKVNEHDLAKSIEISRRDSTIVLRTLSKKPNFAHAKLDQITAAYLGLHEQTRLKRTELRLKELVAREKELVTQLQENDQQTLEVGGEYDLPSLATAHQDKISHIDQLATRRGEVEQTLETILNNDGISSADMNDQEIIRATLLDRALADLNFEKSKTEADLQALLLRYPEHAPVVIAKRTELRVLSRAMGERREQIKVLGQTGALTDTSKGSAEVSFDEINALLAKVTTQLNAARIEAKQLNEKRIRLILLSEEREEIRELLNKTREVLDQIRVESTNLLPSLSVLMSPATVPVEPVKDTSKSFAAAGVAVGGFIALFLVVLNAKILPGIRYSDETWRLSPFFQTVKCITRLDMRRRSGRVRAFNAMRNALMLFPSRMERFEGLGRVILVTKLASGESSTEARELAAAFERADLRTLLVDADVRGSSISGKAGNAPGFFDYLAQLEQEKDLDLSGLTGTLECGSNEARNDGAVSLKKVRKLIVQLSKQNEVVILNGGSVEDTLTTRLLMASCEVCLTVVHPRDPLDKIAFWAEDVHHLPKNGSALLLSGGRKHDPNKI